VIEPEEAGIDTEPNEREIALDHVQGRERRIESEPSLIRNIPADHEPFPLAAARLLQNAGHIEGGRRRKEGNGISQEVGVSIPDIRALRLEENRPSLSRKRREPSYGSRREVS
jgi:hypothetical protein